MSDKKEITPEHEEKQEDLARFRNLAWKYYVYYLDKRGTPITEPEQILFEICAPYMMRIIRRQSNNAKDFSKLQHGPIIAKVAELVRLFLRYYKRKFHPLKNFILLNYLYIRRVYRLTSQGKMLHAAVKQELVQERPLDGAYKTFYEMFDRVKNNTKLLETIFYNTQNKRYKAQGKSKAERKGLCQKRIEQLQTQTSLDIVAGQMELFPGIDDIFIHTRRNLSQKGPYDESDDPYAIWIGEYFMRKILQIPDHKKRDYIFGRILLEGSVRFDTDNDVVLERDEGFGRRWLRLHAMVRPLMCSIKKK